MAISKEEDEELRRLALFAAHGLLRGDSERRFEDLRQRDRRNIVREQAGADYWPDWVSLD
jgi:hypothetical protein